MRFLRFLLLVLVARPLAVLMTGADVTGRERLPLKGPAIIAANHASHVDTLLMLAVFPSRAVSKLRPAAAADYFLRDPVIGWFSRHVIGIVPVARGKAADGEDVLAPARAALAAGEIVLIFPEGARGDGESDEMGQLKSGVARLAEAFPQAPVIPVWIQGAGRVLPKGASVPVPLNCAVLVGEPVIWTGRRGGFMDALRAAMLALKAQAPPLRWSEEP
ncbi:1-acyl-sn-glycerol-3-phosphate acyltransferase [Caulobacter sp. D4A]|uniref:lysophospholipid acyltransferase family protein n=1 Tax=unclassified Caulobacter TaxID=2648921 RepID=UPI000D7334F0|nr:MULTISPECIES: lysophospholipid acyltransferase family protein [unclassified Caulobacter]PXA85757.1 1-acyl-sn-glycerol-3-phosphate acyltransferase [Caulobacter sp. D4A]PXA91572.1 1-acyl-sn-glycerol-3-phosphate acyltransferase [Caulobacter sp. D5]